MLNRLTIQGFDCGDGNPPGGKVGDPDYVAYTTPALVREAHAAGMAVVPWTVGDPATTESLIDAGADGLITDYPDRLRAVLARRGLKPPAPRHQPPRRDCIAEAAAT